MDHGATILLVGLAGTLMLAWGGRHAQSPVLAFVKTVLIVPVPLLLFTVSLLVVPWSQEQCPLGFVDCFQAGKVVLAPVALWGAASLYVVEVRRRLPPQRWAVWGIVSGAVLSVASFVHIVLAVIVVPFVVQNPFERRLGPELILMCALPGYVAVWYVLRAGWLARRGWLRVADAGGLVAVNAPLWAGTVWATHEIYMGLPKTAPECFVVTATARGHRALVGPLVEVAPGRLATRQLLRFWVLEARWRRVHPGSHAAARRIYDRIGPRIAARVRTRWQADVVCLALKPFELIAALVAPAGSGRR